LTSIIRQKVGDKIYLYESVSYRNSDGKPRNKRVPIGKIDPVTGNPVYKPEYLVSMAEKGTPIEISTITNMKFSMDDIKHSYIKDYGAFYLFQNIAKSIGLLKVLEDALPKYWQEIFNLACYLLSSGDPFLYCEDWINSTECLPVGIMSSQRISELLMSIDIDARETFYKMWCQCRSEQEYLALDITSISSYSNLIEDVEWGYNRDKEALPQINLCMLMGEKSGLPIYQTVYSGSLNTSNFAKKQVEGERKDIDSLQNTIVSGGDSIRGVTKLRSWNKDHKVHTHIYFNAIKATKLRENLYAHVTLLKERAEANPVACLHDDDYGKYLLIRNSEKSPSGYTISIKEDAIKKELETAGWMILISNDVTDAKEAIRIYREKDVVEKGFLRLKNSLDLGRLRVHREDTMQNKIFVGFISLILTTHIHKVMLAKEFYKMMTMKKLLLTLSKLRLQIVNGTRILFPLTKDQKVIYKAFNIDEPV